MENKKELLIRISNGTIVEYDGLPETHKIRLIDEDVGTDEILDWGGELVVMKPQVQMKKFLKQINKISSEEGVDILRELSTKINDKVLFPTEIVNIISGEKEEEGWTEILLSDLIHYIADMWE